MENGTNDNAFLMNVSSTIRRHWPWDVVVWLFWLEGFPVNMRHKRFPIAQVWHTCFPMFTWALNRHALYDWNAHERLWCVLLCAVVGIDFQCWFYCVRLFKLDYIICGGGQVFNVCVRLFVNLLESSTGTSFTACVYIYQNYSIRRIILNVTD